MPYSDDDRRRAAKREQARRRRSRPRDGLGPVGPDVGPSDAPNRGNSAEPTSSAATFVGPGVGPDRVPRGVDALLDVVLDELAAVRATRTDPLARGRVVATLVNAALATTKAAETEAKLDELAAVVAQLKTDRDPRPRRLHAK